MSDIAPTVPAAVTSKLVAALRALQIELKPWATAPAVHYMRGLIEHALSAYETAVAAIDAQPATTPAPDVSAAASAAARGTQQPMVPLAIATYLFDTLQKWRELAELPDHATSDSLRDHTKRAGEYYTAAKANAVMPAAPVLTHQVEVVPVSSKAYGAWSRDVVVNGHVLLNGWHHTGAQSFATKLQAALADGTPTQVTDVGNTSQHDELVANVTALANALYRLDLDGTGAVDNMLKVSAIVGNAWIDWLAEHATIAHSPTDIIRRVRQYIDDLPQDDQAVTEAHLEELRLLLSND